MKPDEIQFTELPPTKGRGPNNPYGAVVAKLKERPGEWALVRTGVPNNYIAPYQRHGCEAVSRNSRKIDGGYIADIYARWPEGGE